MLAASHSLADHNRVLAGKKLASPPKIDGVVDPDEWKDAERSGDFVHLNTGEKTSWDCLVFAGYDKDNLYFAFINPDPDPKQIRATEYRRGVDLDGNDHDIILINPFHSFREADQNQFGVSAGGGMSAEFAGGRSAKREWEGEWEAKSRITDKGWECEIRIPWKILRLPAGGKRDIEVNFARSIPRVDLGISWCDIGSNERMDYNGSWKDVEVPSVNLTRELLVLPYQILGYDGERKEAIVNTGVDFRHELSSQITGLASINPDFRNVEGAVLNLAFSRFERLANEKRPFFVEGQSEFRLGGMSASLFSPQRIRSFDMGAKAFGKLNQTDSFGALATTAFGNETAMVGKWHRQWGDQGGVTLGAVKWNDPDNDVSNAVGDVEIVQLGKRWGWDTIYNHTEDQQRGTGKRWDVDLMYRDNNSFASFGWQEITKNFLPRIGFAPRTGYKGWNAFYNHNRQWLSGPWSDMSFEGFAQDFRQEEKEDVYLRSAFLFLSGTTRKSLDIDLSYNYENFLGEEARFGSIGLQWPESDPYHNYEVNYTAGSVDRTPYSNVEASLNWRFKNKVTLSPGVQFERFGSEHAEQHIVGLSYEIDQHRSIGGRAVIRDGDVNWYLAYRKSGNLGAEYYVIVGDPNARTFQNRIILKAVIPVSWRL